MAESESLVDYAYMEEHQSRVYLEDAIAQYLAYRGEGNKSPAMKQFYKEYFTSVHQGTHVLFREFSFVSATPYNRLCVLKAIMQVYKPFFYRDKKFNARDYHSILQLLFPGFQMQVVQDAFTAYDDDKKDEENCLKFCDFVKALKASFCTGEFDQEANTLKAQIETKIEEFSSIPSQSGETSMNLSKSDFFLHVNEDYSRKFASFNFDVTEVRRVWHKYDTSTSDDSGEKPSGSKSKKLKKKKSKGKSKKCGEKSSDKFKDKSEEKSGSAKVNRGRLPKKGLSTSLNILRRGKSEDAKGLKPKIKIRRRSKSVFFPKKCGEKAREKSSDKFKDKSEEKSGSAKVNRGRLPKKGLSTSLNVLQRGKSEDAEGLKPKIKIRRRSKSVCLPKKCSEKSSDKFKDKSEEKSGSAKVNNCCLPKKCLSTSLNVLQRGKSKDAEGLKPKVKIRRRSKSVCLRGKSKDAEGLKPKIKIRRRSKSV